MLRSFRSRICFILHPASFILSSCPPPLSNSRSTNSPARRSPHHQTRGRRLDGFVDKIAHPVLQRQGPGENFQPFPILKPLVNASSRQRVKARASKFIRERKNSVATPPAGKRPPQCRGAGTLHRGAGSARRFNHSLRIRQTYAGRFARRSRRDPCAGIFRWQLMLGQPSSLASISFATIVAAMAKGRSLICCFAPTCSRS